VTEEWSDLMRIDASTAWNREYTQGGIPSSLREEPSGVLTWGLDNLRYLASTPVATAVDLGCGTGRNSVAMSALGIRVCGMDFSEVALEAARSREGAADVDFRLGDVSQPLPYDDSSFDLATDIFVYFHQLSDEGRRHYRSEIRRVLKPGGVLLLSLATDGDGYYAACEPIANWTDISSAPLTWDPIAEVGNVLFSYEQLLTEFSDQFEFQMSWRKRKYGDMHGKRYLRETVAALWVAHGPR